MNSPDPVTLSVLDNRFRAIVDEMGEAMLRTAYSQILNSSRDFSIAICDAQARLLAQADHIPIHVGAMPFAVEAVVDAELDRLASTPPSDAELRRAQRNLEARLYRGLERLNGNGSRADLLNAMQMWRGDPGFVNQLVARYRAVTAAQVRETARRVLARDARVVLIVNPPARTASAQ